MSEVPVWTVVESRQILISAQQFPSLFRGDGSLEALTCEVQSITRADRKVGVVVHQTAAKTVFELFLSPAICKLSRLGA
jgi:hypothetical protein